jgi:hypothetical protein
VAFGIVPAVSSWWKIISKEIGHWLQGQRVAITLSVTGCQALGTVAQRARWLGELHRWEVEPSEC